MARPGHVEFFGLALSAGQGAIGAGPQVQYIPLGRVFEINAADIAAADNCGFHRIKSHFESYR